MNLNFSNATIRRALVTVSALAIGATAAAAIAQQRGPGYGPGMMGGGGPGYGPGMMSGGGPGYGAGASLLESLSLSDEQRDKIQSIQEDNRRKNWTAMGQLRSEMFALRRLYYAEKMDASAIAEQQRKVDELRRQMLKSRLETHAQVEALLTPDQRKQFRQFRPQWMLEGEQ